MQRIMQVMHPFDRPLSRRSARNQTRVKKVGWNPIIQQCVNCKNRANRKCARRAFTRAPLSEINKLETADVIKVTIELQ